MDRAYGKLERLDGYCDFAHYPGDVGAFFDHIITAVFINIAAAICKMIITINYLKWSLLRHVPLP